MRSPESFSTETIDDTLEPLFTRKIGNAGRGERPSRSTYWPNHLVLWLTALADCLLFIHMCTYTDRRIWR